MNNFNQNLPYIYIPTLNAKILIDTGSTRSFISPHLVYQHFPNSIEQKHFEVKTAHGTSFHNEIIKLLLLIEFNINHCHTFYLFDFSSNFQGLIGLDLLEELKAKINISSKLLELPNVQIPILYINDAPRKNPNRPSLKKPYSLTVPPRTEQIVMLPTFQKSGTAILNHIQFNELETPSAIVNVHDNFALTSIINNTEDLIELTLHSPLETEPYDTHETNYLENTTQATANPELDNMYKANLKNLRLDHCNQEEYDAIRSLCYEFRDIFHSDEIPLTFTNAIKHEINLTKETPVFTKTYRYPYIHKNEVHSQIDKMLKSDIIQPSFSPWSSPIWIVPKKLDASQKIKWRMVIDYRKLNENTIDDKYPLPNITDILDKLGKCNYFTTLDLANGFHQIEMKQQDIPKTAFSTENGHFEFKRMPFGLKNAPSTFQRVMNNILRGYQNEICSVYLDDIIIFSTSLQEHTNRLRKIFQRLRESNFKIQLDKSEFLKHNVNYLGHIITPNGIEPNPDKIRAVKDFPIPTTPKEIKSFLGLTGYYRKFIKDFAKISKPMTNCLKKDSKVIHTKEFVKAFNHLKNLLINSPVLQYPDFNKPFVLTTDASNFAVGAVLSQGNPPNDRPISYISRTLNTHECNYSTIEKELLSIVWSCKMFRPYLFGRKFLIYTDHRPLVWLFNLKEPNSKLIRWRLKLEEYNYEIIYKKGKQNINADALSRIKLNALETESTINQPGDINKDITHYLRELAEDPITHPDLTNQNAVDYDNEIPVVFRYDETPPTNNSRKINILQEVTLQANEPPTIHIPEDPDFVSPEFEIQNIPDENETVHTASQNNDHGIPILDEIINNKSFQLIIERNPHHKLEVKTQNIDGSTVKNVKIPLHSPKLITQLLKEHINPSKTIYIYFHDRRLIPTFTTTHNSKFIQTKLVICTQLINTILDKEERLTLIRNHHEGKSNHRGIEETYQKLKSNYYWKNQKANITSYINNCDTCQRAKYARQRPYVPLVITDTPSRPFQVIHMDTFIFETQTFLTLFDKFSKLGQAFPCTRDAISVHDNLIKYFSYYGVPEAIITDNGTEFKNTNIQELLKSHKIRIHFTTPRHHESNSPVERFHSTLIEHLRLLREKEPELTLTKLMTYATIAYNTSIQSTLKTTPFEIVLGHTNSKEPLEVIETTFYSDYVNNHKKRTQILYDAIKNLEVTHKQKVIEKSNARGEEQTEFKINQKVFKALTERSKAKNKSKGPFLIIELLDHNKAKI